MNKNKVTDVLYHLTREQYLRFVAIKWVLQSAIIKLYDNQNFIRENAIP